MEQQVIGNINISLLSLKAPYMRPEVEVFELEFDGCMLAGSGDITNSSSVLPGISDDGTGSFDEY